MNVKNELTNLLPTSRKKAIRRLYTVRLSSVVIVIAAFLVCSYAALKTPSYVYQYQQSKVAETRLMTVTSKLNESNGQEVNTRFKAVNDDITYLSRLATSTSATTVLSSILQIPHQGVVLSGISYAPGSKGVGGKVTLNGTATTREALHQYVDALNKADSIKNADLPISAYAKETDIPFTLTLTLTL